MGKKFKQIFHQGREIMVRKDTRKEIQHHKLLKKRRSEAQWGITEQLLKWEESEETEAYICLRGCKMAQPFWKTFWQFLKLHVKLSNVLVYGGCHDKRPQTGRLKTTQVYSLTVPEARIEVQGQGVSVFGFSWGLSPDLQTAAFLLCPHMELPLRVHIPDTSLCVQISFSYNDTNQIRWTCSLTAFLPLKDLFQIPLRGNVLEG